MMMPIRIESQISLALTPKSMIDFERHFKRLQDALEVKNALEKNCVDMIDEGLWWNVMYQLNQASIEAADELQAETGKPYPKDSRVMVAAKSVEELQILTGDSYDTLFRDPAGNPIARKNQKYSEAPPMRLLSMALNLCYWLGYHDADKGHELHKEGGIGAWDRIEMAYKDGYAANSKPSSGQASVKTAGTF
jgi:hypothetical protein